MLFQKRATQRNQ